MPKGHWSFIHEWIIYDYVLARAEEKTLRLKHVISSGKLLGKPKWVKVEEVLPITGTTFPDIQGIKLKGQNSFRVAEVKFTTSLFNYHLDPKYRDKFVEFTKSKGFILVASHDHLPNNVLIELYPDVDVFEIEVEDFVAFCRENFSRLLNRQIKAHSSTRVWLMYQGPNFNEGGDKILPGRQSMIWCPTENLNGFDLAPGDRILFYKTQGLDRIKLQNGLLKEKTMNPKWILKEIYVAEVKSKIFSRAEYHQYKNHSGQKQLWKNDPPLGKGFRWNRVFEFVNIKVIKVEVSMSMLYANPHSHNFAVKAWEAFCFGKSREISHEDYRNLLEVLSP
jgi:hypothetical protein